MTASVLIDSLHFDWTLNEEPELIRMNGIPENALSLDRKAK